VRIGQLYTNFAKSRSEVDFYWADGGSVDVVCSPSFNAQSMGDARTTFTVIRPAATMAPSIIGPILVDNNYDYAPGIYLHFAGFTTNQTNFVPGIKFQIYGADTNGFYFFAQIATIHRLWNPINLRSRPFPIDVTGIDSGSASGPWQYPFNSLVGTNAVSDSPGLICYSTDNTVQVGDSFKMYLMVSNNTPKALPVTLQEVDWGWSATATNVDRFHNQWDLEPNAAPWKSNAVSTTTFPQWAKWANPSP
jgi:hypothetical protein